MLLSVMFVTADCIAQKTFTVDECVDYAFRHNPLLHAASKEVSIADIDIQRAKGAYLPRASFVSAFQYYFSKRQLLVEGGSSLAPPNLEPGEPMAIKTGYNNSWYPTVNVNQLIFSPSYRSSYNIAVQGKELQEQQFASFKIDIIAGIHKAYNTCKLLEIQIDFLKGNIARIDTLIDLTRTKFEKGAGVKLEVNRVEVTGNRMKSELVNVRNAFTAALLALQFQMNYLEKDTMLLTTDFSIEEVAKNAHPLSNQLLESNMTQRVESRLLQTQIALADESIKLERARGRPSLGADGSLGFTPAANKIDKMFQGERWKPYSYVGVNLVVPIFNGLDVKRAVEQRKLQASQSRNYLDQFSNQFENEKKLTFTEIRNAYERYLYADANLKLANNNIYLLHEAFVNGIADNQDLILGENDLYENQARYFNELLSLLLSEVEGLRVSGSFNAKAGL
ncbi:MAG TPA: TolC family protein [Flavitalea sp.]|nr:TolC family protein [Flavitalea sp.]